MSPLMRNKFPNQRKGGNRYLVRLISPFLTLGPFFSYEYASIVQILVQRVLKAEV